MRPGEYWAVARAYVNAERDRLCFQANQTRQLAAVLVNMFSKRKVKKLKELWLLPTDEDAEQRVVDTNSISNEQRKEQIARLLKMAEDGK